MNCWKKSDRTGELIALLFLFFFFPDAWFKPEKLHPRGESSMSGIVFSLYFTIGRKKLHQLTTACLVGRRKQQTLIQFSPRRRWFARNLSFSAPRSFWSWTFLFWSEDWGAFWLFWVDQRFFFTCLDIFFVEFLKFLVGCFWFLADLLFFGFTVNSSSQNIFLEVQFYGEFTVFLFIELEFVEVFVP